jgi:hypothetical protein
MHGGLLKGSEDIWIRLGPQKTVTKASEEVTRTEHEQELKTILFESDFVLDHMEEFASGLALGEPKFASVSEQRRQTTFRYSSKGGVDSILLTRAHQGIDNVLAAMRSHDE